MTPWAVIGVVARGQDARGMNICHRSRCDCSRSEVGVRYELWMMWKVSRQRAVFRV